MSAVLENELQSRQMIRSQELIHSSAFSLSSSNTMTLPGSNPFVMKEMESGTLSGTISAAFLRFMSVR